MSYNKRSSIEIIAEILFCISSGPLRKTHITFRCNLDSRAVERYIRALITFELIKKSDEDKNYYEIQQKGLLFLERYKQLLSVLSINKELRQEVNSFEKMMPKNPWLKV
jgi:predicted transcriptional regulator